MDGLDDVQQPKNQNNHENGSKTAAGTVSPVARVPISREGPKEKKHKNNDDDQFQDIPPKSGNCQARLIDRCLLARLCYPLKSQQKNINPSNAPSKNSLLCWVAGRSALNFKSSKAANDVLTSGSYPGPGMGRLFLSLPYHRSHDSHPPHLCGDFARLSFHLRTQSGLAFARQARRPQQKSRTPGLGFSVVAFS